MSENTTATSQARTVTTTDHGKLDIRALVLLAILLAAGFILNFTVGKAISGVSGGMISPEFIISAFCLVPAPAEEKHPTSRRRLSSASSPLP